MPMSSSEAPTKRSAWSEIPELPLSNIVNLLVPTLQDLIAFASVCRSWRSFLRSLSPSLLPSIPPLLLNLRPSSSSSHPSPQSCFFTPNIQSVPFPSSPLLLSSYRFLSFSHGYLLFLPNSDPFQPFLNDVMNGSRIILPPLPSDSHRLPYYYATLTAPPLSPSSSILLFFSNYAFLSYQLSGPGMTWTRHGFSPDISLITHVVTFKNRLFGLNDCTKLLELDLSSDQTHAAVRFVNVPQPPRVPNHSGKCNFGPQLVCTANQIFLVVIFFNQVRFDDFFFGQGITTKIEVYSLDKKKMEWVQVKRLHDSAIFIDFAGKTSILCEKLERWGGESNCVYVAGPGYDRSVMCFLDERRATGMPPLFYLDIHRSNWLSPICSGVKRNKR